MPPLGLKIERDVILASLVSDLRLLNGVSVSRFLQCYINLGSITVSELFHSSFMLSTCSLIDIYFGVEIYVQCLKYSGYICCRIFIVDILNSGYLSWVDILKVHAELTFLSVEQIKYFVSLSSHIFWQKWGGIFIFSSSTKFWLKWKLLKKREWQFFSDRDTDTKHKLIRHFLRKIPAPLSLTEWVTFAQECLCFLCKHLVSVILVSLL